MACSSMPPVLDAVKFDVVVDISPFTVDSDGYSVEYYYKGQRLNEMIIFAVDPTNMGFAYDSDKRAFITFGKYNMQEELKNQRKPNMLY